MSDDRDSLPIRERYEAAMAREQEAAVDDRERPSAEDIADNAPSGRSDPAWPVCRVCRRKIRGGLPCVAAGCPWHRRKGEIVDPIRW